MKSKTLNNTSFEEVKQNVSDVQSKGDPNTFRLICKAWSKSEGWMKSTKAMEISNIGCIIQVTTQQDTQVAEALTFVPGVRLQEKEDGTIRIVRLY